MVPADDLVVSLQTYKQADKKFCSVPLREINCETSSAELWTILFSA